LPGAAGEIWLSPLETPANLLIFDIDSISNYRWWASWILVAGFFMIAIFYIFWFWVRSCIIEKYTYGEKGIEENK